jgi:hypothetical protein
MIAYQSFDSVFKVFEDPYNLAKITPGSLSFEVTSKERVVMRKGAEIEYTIKWLGLPMHWKTLIVEYEPPFLFVDEQVKGPYSLWRHRHTFEAAPDGVNVADHVDYALPFGVLGDLAHALTVGRQLLGIFNYRQEKLKDLLRCETRSIQVPTIRKKLAV